LELIIKNISREISNKEQESQNAQRSWLKFQAELLEKTSKSSAIAEDIENNQMKLSVLKRKKLVLESQFDSENHELQEYQRNIRKIQKDIERICSMVVGHKTTRAKLEDNNFSLQQELRSNLKVSYELLFIIIRTLSLKLSGLKVRSKPFKQKRKRRYRD
jgi:chromosome segregation ATPase